VGLFDKLRECIDSIRLGKNNTSNSIKVKSKPSLTFAELDRDDPTTKRILAQAKKAGYEIKTIPKVNFNKVRVISPTLNDSKTKRILVAYAKQTCNEIETIPQQYRNKVAKAVLDNFYGTLPEGRSLLVQLQSICQISKREALTIATDQTAKLNGRRTQAEQEAIGIDEYEWSSTGDPCGFLYGSAEHPGHTDHYDMDKALCKWSDASIYSKDSGKTWIKRMEKNQGATPGSTFLCRCVALARVDLEKIIAHAKKEDK
jgi:uncharacterized protein with gpF-like domain